MPHVPPINVGDRKPSDGMCSINLAKNVAIPAAVVNIAIAAQAYVLTILTSVELGVRIFTPSKINVNPEKWQAG